MVNVKVPMRGNHSKLDEFLFLHQNMIFAVVFGIVSTMLFLLIF